MLCVGTCVAKEGSCMILERKYIPSHKATQVFCACTHMCVCVCECVLDRGACKWKGAGRHSSTTASCLTEGVCSVDMKCGI